MDLEKEQIDETGGSVVNEVPAEPVNDVQPAPELSAQNAAPAPTGYPAAPAPAVYPPVPQSENMIAGIVGAFLLSLVGGLLYFAIYQVGYIAGICGLVIFILANFGYQLFSGRKNSTKGAVTAIIMLVLITLLAEYLCLSYEIYKAYKETITISFFDAVRATPDFLTEPEIAGAVARDVLIALALGFVAAFSTVRSTIRANRFAAQQAAMAAASSPQNPDIPQ